MGDIGTPMTSGTIPTVGTAGTGYATTINAFLTEVKQRLEDPVPLTSLLIGPLAMANNAISNIAFANLHQAASAPTVTSGSLYNLNGDLWYVSNSGAIQLTTGSTLNAASVGGITGNYGGANPARFKFVDADKEYYAYDDEAGAAWAYIWARGFDIAGDLTSTHRIRLTTGTVGTNYTMTLPVALPAATALVQIDNTGAMTYTNLVGDLKFGDKVLVLSPAAFNIPDHTQWGIVPTPMKLQAISASATPADVYMAIPLNTGDRIKTLTMAVLGNGTADFVWSVVKTTAAGADSTIGTTTINNAAASWGDQTLDVTDTTLAAGETLTMVLHVTSSSSAAINFGNVRITYDRP